jgi:hypothetical protein
MKSNETEGDLKMLECYEQELVSKYAAAMTLGVSYKTFYKHFVLTGRVRQLKIGSRTVYRLRSILTLIEKLEKEAKKPQTVKRPGKLKKPPESNKLGKPEEKKPKVEKAA